MGTDGIVVVQGHHDAGVRNDAPYQSDELDADQQRMMDMHDIRPELLEEAHEVRHRAVAVDLAHVEAVEMPAPEDDLVGCLPNRLEARAGTLLTMKAVRRCQEERLDICALTILAEEIVREDFRPSGMEVRMIVSDDEDAQGQAMSSGFTAMMMSW